MNVYIGKPVEYSDMQWPCPDGFHIPSNNDFLALKSMTDAIGVKWSWVKTYLKMPFAWYRWYTNWNVSDTNTSWAYWSCEWTGTNCYYTWLASNILTYNWTSVTMNWQSIRPFKDTAVEPDSSWNLLVSYTYFSVYHNPTLWLISIGWNWYNWITIADKNLWATTVYNDWDTLSEANCGKFYQRWNNYWFPRSWSITTSSTQVNAQNYWPWNYYSSSTFIVRTSSPRYWDSSVNLNLRWWVSQWSWTKDVELQNAYIWEVYEYSYDFRNKSATILANDGWTNASSNTTTFSSQWITGTSIRYTKPIDLSNASRLTLSYTWTWGAYDEYGFRVWQTVTTSTRAWLTGANYTYNQIYMSLFSTSSTYFSWVSSWSHKIDFILDFNAKTFEIKLDWSSFQNWTVTDSQILDIKNKTTVLFAYVSWWWWGGYYLETVNLILEK